MSPLQFRKYRVGIKVALCSWQWKWKWKKKSNLFWDLTKAIHGSPFSLLHLCPPPCLLVAHDLCIDVWVSVMISRSAISRSQILRVVFVRYWRVYFSDIVVCIYQILSCVFLWYFMCISLIQDATAWHDCPKAGRALLGGNISISDLTSCICQIFSCVFIKYFQVHFSDIVICISLIQDAWPAWHDCPKAGRALLGGNIGAEANIVHTAI